MTGSIDRRTALALLLTGAAMPGPAWSQAPARLSPAVPAALDAAVRGELGQKAIPSLAIALVDRSGVLWSGGWGFEDEAKTRPADPDTLYRTGSVGRLVTDLLIQQLVDARRIDLDQPVTAYLPDFAPNNPFGAPVTLRHLAEHRSGLVRDPPAGSSYDLREGSLIQAALALNRTELLFKPGSQVKYSDAGLNLLALVVEQAWRAPYAAVAAGKLFGPLGLTHSGYTPAEASGVLAYAEIGSYDSGRMPAPLTQDDAALGGLHSTANDLGRLVQAVLTAPAGKASGPGLEAGTVAGKPGLGQGSSVLGCTTQVRMLPGEGLGVAVLGALNDCPSMRRLADHALALLLAERGGRAPPAFPLSERLGAAAAKALAGHYADGETSLFLRELGGGLYLEAPRAAGEVRALGPRHLLDDPHAFSEALEIDPAGRWVGFEGRRYLKGEWARPAPPPAGLAGLIGDYGWEQAYLRVYERDGRPCVRMGWADYEPMTQAGADGLAFDASAGLYPMERLQFVRNDQGQGDALLLNGLAFPRRDFGAEMLVRTRSMAQNGKGLRAAARRARPPQETGKAAPDLVPIRSADPSIRLDVRYATSNNFMGFPLYAREGAYLERPAAEAVARASQALHAQGFGLVIHDGYRPWFVTKMFWDATPPEGHVFVADPSQGSRHNRGAAVDLSLYDLSTGETVQMTGGYDEMSSRSYPQYVGGTSLQRWRRDLLRGAMEAQGFEVYAAEWWHFDFAGWDRYPILNLDFDQIDKAHR